MKARIINTRTNAAEPFRDIPALELTCEQPSELLMLQQYEGRIAIIPMELPRKSGLVHPKYSMYRQHSLDKQGQVTVCIPLVRILQTGTEIGCPNCGTPHLITDTMEVCDSCGLDLDPQRYSVIRTKNQPDPNRSCRFCLGTKKDSRGRPCPYCQTIAVRCRVCEGQGHITYEAVDSKVTQTTKCLRCGGSGKEHVLRAEYYNGEFCWDCGNKRQCPTCGVNEGIEFDGPQTKSEAEDEEPVECPTCAGHGELLTQGAGGDKLMVNCPDCDGRGETYLSQIPEHRRPGRKEQCPDCYGTGYAPDEDGSTDRCEVCEGSGFAPPPDVDWPKDKCDVCEGTGKAPHKETFPCFFAHCENRVGGQELRDIYPTLLEQFPKIAENWPAYDVDADYCDGDVCIILCPACLGVWMALGPQGFEAEECSFCEGKGIVHGRRVGESDQETPDCPVCDGSGLVVVCDECEGEGELLGFYDSENEPQPTNCEKCNGRGKVPAPQMPGPNQLPVVTIDNDEYYLDHRLQEFRAVDNPLKRISFTTFDRRDDASEILEQLSEDGVCRDCHGTGLDVDEYTPDCPTCNGAGRVIAQDPGTIGRGPSKRKHVLVDCDMCNGTGVVDAGPDSPELPDQHMGENCPKCNATGKLGLDQIQRTYLHDPKCGSRGWEHEPCPKCGIDGQKDCPECFGNGEVYKACEFCNPPAEIDTRDIHRFVIAATLKDESDHVYVVTANSTDEAINSIVQGKESPEECTTVHYTYDHLKVIMVDGENQG